VGAIEKKSLSTWWLEYGGGGLIKGEEPSTLPELNIELIYSVH